MCAAPRRCDLISCNPMSDVNNFFMQSQPNKQDKYMYFVSSASKAKSDRQFSCVSVTIWLRSAVCWKRDPCLWLLFSTFSIFAFVKLRCDSDKLDNYTIVPYQSRRNTVQVIRDESSTDAMGWIDLKEANNGRRSSHTYSKKELRSMLHRNIARMMNRQVFTMNTR